MDINLLADRISNINQKYSSINYGGCGTFSFYLNKSLKENYNIDTDIVYIISDNPPAGKPDYDVKFSHIMIKLDNLFIDNNGIYESSNLPIDIILSNLSSNKLEEMINIPEIWNNIFDHTQKENLKNDILKI